MITTKKALIAGAAFAGLLAGVGAPVHASNLLSGIHPSLRAAGVQDTGGSKDQKSTKDKKDAKHDCAGKNSCKGKGGCKTSDGGCKGKNSCKGKGGCRTDGKPMTPKT